jgi:uncharacterized protein
MQFLYNPWHWSVAGVLIGLIVPALLLLGNKPFGISSNLRHLCAICIPNKIPFFNYNWKAEIWNLFLVIGIILGAVIASQLLSNPNDIQLAATTKAQLQAQGINTFSKQAPPEIFSLANIFTLRGLLFFVVGGFLVGFGTRYAAGCTSGHSIFGIATLQWPSIVATICFMAGGFFSANFIVPFLLKISA